MGGPSLQAHVMITLLGPNNWHAVSKSVSGYRLRNHASEQAIRRMNIPFDCKTHLLIFFGGSIKMQCAL